MFLRSRDCGTGSVGGRIYISSMNLKNCPSCKAKGSIRQIIWGMPEFPVDESKYSIGGCCVSPDGNDPTHECIKCGWQRMPSGTIAI